MLLGAVHKCQHFRGYKPYTFYQKMYGLYTHENVDIYEQPLMLIVLTC